MAQANYPPLAKIDTVAFPTFEEANNYIKNLPPNGKTGDYTQGIIELSSSIKGPSHGDGKYLAWYMNDVGTSQYLNKFIKNPLKFKFDNQEKYPNIKISRIWITRLDGKDLLTMQEVNIHGIKERKGLKPIKEVEAEYKEERKRIRS